MRRKGRNRGEEMEKVIESKIDDEKEEEEKKEKRVKLMLSKFHGDPVETLAFIGQLQQLCCLVSLKLKSTCKVAFFPPFFLCRNWTKNKACPELATPDEK